MVCVDLACFPAVRGGGGDGKICESGGLGWFVWVWGGGASQRWWAFVVAPRRAGTHSQELGGWRFVYRDGCGFGGFGWFWHGCGAPDLEKFGGGACFFHAFEQLGGIRREYSTRVWWLERAFFTSSSSSGRFVESTARGFGGFGGWSVLFSRVRAARGDS